MKSLNIFYIFTICAFVMSSCASVTGYEEGRTLGEGNSEFGISLNYISTPDLFADDDVSDIRGFPNIEAVYKYGVMEKLDIGGRVSSNLNVGAFAKYQVVGDRSSNFSLSPGLEIATFAGLGYAIHVPVYASLHPNENVSINFSPRFVYQFATIENGEGLTYLGGNVGLLAGKKHKFGIDVGFYNIGGLGTNANLITFGLGGRFRFGNNMTATSSRGGDDGKDRNERKRRKRR